MKNPRLTSLLFALTLASSPIIGVEPNESIVSHIPRTPIHSTGIAAIGYSKRLHALEVEFVNGAVYRYLDVPSQLYRDLLKAESKAQYYDQYIRGKFRSVHVRTRAHP